MAQSLTETLNPGLSYWLAYDASLNPHKFRVIKYEMISETFYTTEYGYVSYRKENGHNVANIKPKGRQKLTIVFGEEEVSEQHLLSLLVYWTVEPLFLAVPVSNTNQEQSQQESLF